MSQYEDDNYWSKLYKMDAKQELNLSINNLLDREDNLGHTGTYYYSTPINFLLSYKLSF